MKSDAVSLLPRQRRSRETVERLLMATVRVLDSRGLEGALVPRIAKAAGVAPASIYRRFADKDALLRSAFLHVLQQSNEANRKHLKTLLLRGSLEETVPRLIALLFQQYRAHPKLLRALSTFVDTDLDGAFADRARSMIAKNLREIVAVLIIHRSEIRHRSPQRALEFAILSASSSIEAIVLDPTSLWNTVLPLSDKELAAHLSRGFVAYLRADD